MTAPRLVLPGRTYLLTRRCSERRFLLRPDRRTGAIFLYCLAEAAERFGLRVIAWLAMSNHYHAVVEDPHGVLPDFLCHFHKLSARALNARWGRWENLWAAEPASAVRLVELADVLDKVVYALANPVADQLVECAIDWPGASSFAALDGRQIELERPRGFFRPDGVMPELVALRAEAPSEWPGGEAAWAAAVGEGVRAAEDRARLARAESGQRVVGRRAIRDASHHDRPSTLEPRRKLRPHLACANAARRITELRALRAFRIAYQRARERLVAGLTALFPRGTWKMVRELGAKSEAAPA